MTASVKLKRSVSEMEKKMTKSVGVLGGNEIIIQGALEAGFTLLTGYPGSPVADYFNILYEKKKELEKLGVRVAIGNSEANAAAMVGGAKVAGQDSLMVIKSMGLHVAADALSVGNFADPGEIVKDDETGLDQHPGVVVLVGDDPWSVSTSTPADSRYLFKHLHMPFLEPSNPQELKDWMKIALKISKRTSVYVGMVLTTAMAEGGGRVTLAPHIAHDITKKQLGPLTFDLQKNVMVPPNSLHADKMMALQRNPQVLQAFKDLGLDKIFANQESRIGIISVGAVFETCKQVLQDMGILEQVSLYKCASSYPLIAENLAQFCQGLEHLVIVEEKRGFLENELLQVLKSLKLSPSIHAKYSELLPGEELFPSYGGLSYEIIHSKLCLLFGRLPVAQQDVIKSSTSLADQAIGNLPRRLPTFCPGCPHRETLSVIKDIRKTLEKKNIQLITHGDVGCYSLSFLPPFKEMHDLSAMGQGGALGAGLDIFSANPSVVLMGDSTFFHSGLTDISNSVQLGHNITYIILNNGNTAMTGHQVTPVSGESVEGIDRPKQDILQIVKGMGVLHAVQINPSDRYFYKNLLLDFVMNKGTRVIVSDKECGLTYQASLKKSERAIFKSGKVLSHKVFYQINTWACEDCRMCVEMTGCPGLTQIFDAYGPKVAIDPQICVADSYCTKIKVCPSFEQVEVSDYHPTKYQKNSNEFEDDKEIPLALQAVSLQGIVTGACWRAIVTGVGGTGVTTISKVLAKAAIGMGGRDDLDFKFMDQKGLAQRNGRVTGHLVIHPKEKSATNTTPLGMGNLLIATDLLDGSESLSFLSDEGVAILDSKYQYPLSIMLDKSAEAQQISAPKLEALVKERLGHRAFILPLSEMSEKYLGSVIYRSAMALGAAFQIGTLPFSLADLKQAFELALPATLFADNWKAFRIGRMLIIKGSDYFIGDASENSAINIKKVMVLLHQSLEDSFPFWQHKKFFSNTFDRNLQQLIKLFPQISKLYLAQYLHDILVYDRGAQLEEFMRGAGSISVEFETLEEKIIGLRAWAKTFVIKDEVYISHIMLSPFKRHLDRHRFQNLGTSFKLKYINRPCFPLLGKNIEFDFSPRPWMLKIMRHCRLIRYLLPKWHYQEKSINRKLKTRILSLGKDSSESRLNILREIDSIKGYREVRFDKYNHAQEKIFT